MKRPILLGAACGLVLGLLLAGCHNESENSRPTLGETESVGTHRWKMHVTVAKKQGGKVAVVQKEDTP